MRKNRRIPVKRSVIMQRAAHVGAIILSFFFAVILNLLATSSCNQLMKSIGSKERELARLEDECKRESARWEEMRTPERLEHALVSHNLVMRYPKASQTIRMRSDGRPYPNQLSVAKASMRVHPLETATASYRQPAAVRSAAAQPRRRAQQTARR